MRWVRKSSPPTRLHTVNGNRAQASMSAAVRRGGATEGQASPTPAPAAAGAEAQAGCPASCIPAIRQPGRPATTHPGEGNERLRVTSRAAQGNGFAVRAVSVVD